MLLGFLVSNFSKTPPKSVILIIIFKLVVKKLKIILQKYLLENPVRFITNRIDYQPYGTTTIILAVKITWF